MSDRPRDLGELRAELARVAREGDLVERTFEVVALVEEVAAPLGIHPVVVGGMAVSLSTLRRHEDADDHA